ncbi:MAG: lytic transglycosylase domain-containing protein [Acidobacteriia bacterium]|nr:lytic transglycosylase domain-containing protein [Terriglobia bacterium]
MGNPPEDLLALARQAAAVHGLDAALVCAVIEQESAWNPWAMRFEPAFYAKYVAPLCGANALSPTEAQARAFSWGLMQVMGQVARENGFSGRYLAELCVPPANLAVGCTVLAKKLAAAGGDLNRGLLAWNGGGNAAYPAQVLARRSRYS